MFASEICHSELLIISYDGSIGNRLRKMKCNIWILEMSQLQNAASKKIIEAGNLFRICV